jgi:predicted RND superfamily exporter protein
MSAISERIHAFVDSYFRGFIGPYHAIVSIASLLVTALAVYVIATTWNINSDFKALLPHTSAAAKAMDEVSDRVGSGSALFVVVDSPDGEANLKFAEDYSAALREMDQVALAHYHNDKAFFEKNALLYMQAEDIRTLHDRLKKRIREEKKAANPLFVSLKKKKKNDGDFVDTSDIEEKYDDQAQDAYKEYLVADDGYSLTIVVRFVESSSNLLATNKLIETVRKTGDDLNPSSYHPDMKIEFGGGLVNRQKEYNSILDDIKSSAIFTVVGLFLVIGLYFRRLRAIALVLGPLIMGIAWTLAIAFTVFGELTVVTVFIFAILLGLGIDFSIHLLHGYDHEREVGKEPVDALIACYNGVGRATVIGAFTTFATFVVLSFAQFRGLSQFGTAAAIGVLCSLTAMCVSMPAFVLSLHKLFPHEPKPASALFKTLALEHWLTDAFVKKLVPVAIAIVLGFSAFSVVYIPDLFFQENFKEIGEINPPWVDVEMEYMERETGFEAIRTARHVRNFMRERRKELEPETYVPDREQLTTGKKYSSAVGGRQSSVPTILLFDTPEAAARVSDYMTEAIEAGDLPTIKSVGSIHAFMPGTQDEQKARVAEAKRIEALLDKEGTAFLDDEQKKRVGDLRKQLDISPVTVKDLPAWTKRLFKEAGPHAFPAAEGEPFAYEYLVYTNLAVNSMIGEQGRAFLKDLEKVREATGEDIRIGSPAYVYVAMLDEIKNDGPRFLGYALVVVLLILIVAFRSPGRAFVALIPLTLGVTWMFGFCGWFGIPLDFFNVIIIPVIVGIGVDDGVHFYYRYLDLGRGGIDDTLRQVGSAVTMTSVTSAIGFGGLAITNYPGLVSIGWLAITGIAGTFIATVLVLPGVLWLSEYFDVSWIAAPDPQSTSD